MVSRQTSRRWRIIRKQESQRYNAISDYGIIGDQRTCALVGIDGSIDWFCVPRFDSPSVFAALLDWRKGGRFAITPSRREFSSLQYYDGPTNILMTEFKTPKGQVRMTDFMPCFRVNETTVSTGEIHRRVTHVSGDLELQIAVEPRMNYGSVTPRVTHMKGIGYSFSPEDGPVHQELAFITPIVFDDSRDGIISKTLSLDGGETLDLVIRYGGIERHHLGRMNTAVKLKETRAYWNRWAGRCRYRGRWREEVMRSALTLKLLFYSPTGAIVAAPTTSLPEEMHGSRNWDYRYSWIRDSSFVLWALHSIGHDEVEAPYLKWLTSTFFLTAGNLQVMLGINGERDLSEQTLEHLSGYRDSHPVRIGNGAWNQFQLDVYGILLDALYFSHRHLGGVNRTTLDYMIRPIVKAVERNWDKPDCGIWEVRGRKEHFVYSKVWCWVALDRAIRIADELGAHGDVREWSKLRDRIRQTTLTRGWNDSVGSFVRSFGSSELDAANLLMPQVRFIAPDDPRMLATIDQTMKKLMKDGLVYRYRSEDGLAGEEGAFLICSFWLVNCLTMAGRVREAERMFNRLLKYSNHLGLYSEELDPASGQKLGNFPQAFTHMGLISAAVNLSRATSGAE